ncbi:hypothetical protein PanWU01x14_271990 [Parasponia andersonii]|uniref:Uncharacterized protein n=1 Tax=Parasponia andersonii TaxID=3476 RepID=A0A2P5B4G6_PARAD|nr:hypothetical protein PanWU01x14_271990 [Parasponia andersonii]
MAAADATQHVGSIFIRQCLSRKANSNDKLINLLWKLFMHKMTSFCEDSDVQIRHKLLHCPICSPLCPETFKTSHRGKHRLRGILLLEKGIDISCHCPHIEAAKICYSTPWFLISEQYLLGRIWFWTTEAPGGIKGAPSVIISDTLSG